MARTPEQIEALLDKVENLLGEYDKAVDGYNRDGWKAKHGEKLGKYADALKALNGDDFDIINASYDEYNSEYKDVDEDEYIASLLANLDGVLDKLRGALGEDKVEVESDEDKTEIVNHEDVAEVTDEPAAEEPKEEEPAKEDEAEPEAEGEVETKTEDEADVETETEAEPDAEETEEDFIASLEKDMKR